MTPENEKLSNAMFDVQSKIREKNMEKTRSAMFRSKACWFRDGEKPTKYFLSLERSNYNKKVITSLINENENKVTRNPDEILKLQCAFYTDLYNAKEGKHFNLSNNTSCRVSDDDISLLDAEISYNELQDAVDKLKKEKTPGADGLTSEFFQYFWMDLRHLIYTLYKKALDVGYLPCSSRRGVISLIPKKGRDMNYVKNWRPLTMLNTDYKILAVLLSNRIKIVLLYLIAEDQTGFMAGRQIATTIRKVIDATEFGNLMSNPGYIINTDFEKCFDLITYNGINGALDFFNFPASYKSLVNLLLEGFESCVTNNGNFSDFFPVTRSCHQGL